MSRFLLAAALLLTAHAAHAETIQLAIDGLDTSEGAILDMSGVRRIGRQQGGGVAPIAFQRAFAGHDDLYAWYAAAVVGTSAPKQVTINILDDAFVVQATVVLDDVLPCGWILPAYDAAIETFTLCARSTDRQLARPALEDAFEASDVATISMSIEGLEHDGDLTRVDAIESFTHPVDGTTLEPIVIERAVADDDLAAWYAEVQAGTVEPRAISLVGLDGSFVGVRETALTDAWPCGWSIDAAQGTEIITLCAASALEQ